MACERFQNAVTDVAAGAPASRELEAHLAWCAACRQELDALRRALVLVDDDLRQLLTAEPAPDLAARIRQAATEREPSYAFRPGFWLQALGAAVLLAVALVAFRGKPNAARHVASVAPRPEQASGTPRPGPAAESTLNAAAVAPVAPTLTRAVRASRRGNAPAEPEVIVPPGGAEALVRLVALVHREQIQPSVLASVGQPSADLAEPAPIDIKPLEIVPLDPAESSGT
jgi:hypothetical protein